MQNSVEWNISKIIYNILLDDAYSDWLQHPEKSFMTCWKQSLDSHGVVSKKNGKLRNSRDVLKTAIQCVKSTASTQVFCYAYEMLNKNYDSSLKQDKSTFERLKRHILEGPSNFNNDQILNHIRQAISHNDDMAEPHYDYSYMAELFTFLPPKKKSPDDTTKVTISQKDLLELIATYFKNINGFKQFDYKIEPNVEKIKSSKPILTTQDFIKLRNLQTNEIIPPDSNQIIVIRDIIKGLRSGEIQENDNLNFFYPYKQNVLNNFIRASDFLHILNWLYPLRSEDYYTFNQKTKEYAPTELSEFKNIGDITTQFTINRIFTVFSTTPNKTLTDGILSKVASYTDIPRIRNSIMHGTFFKDLNANVYMYDAPPKHKTEEELTFIDKFEYNDLHMISNMFLMAKKQKLEEVFPDDPEDPTA